MMDAQQKIVRLTRFLWVLLITVSSCTTRHIIITDDKVVGVWNEDGKTCQQACGMFRFLNNNRFEAKEIPDSCFGYVPHLDIVSRFDASGSWNLIAPDDQLGDYKLDLFFDSVETEEGQVSYHRTAYINSGRQEILYCWVGDESNKVKFKKSTSEIVTTP